MRLDEWQKYIEAQFLDEVDAVANHSQPSTHTQPAASTPTPTAATVPCEEPQADVRSGQANPIHETPVAAFSIDAEPPQQMGQPAPTLDPIPTSAPVASIVETTAPQQNALSADTSCQVSAAIRSPFADFDLDIPGFDAYLPSSHRAARSDHPRASMSAAAQPAVDPEPALPIAPTAPTHVPETAPPPMAVETLPQDALTLDRRDDRSTPPSNIRRAPRSRARHARNVRPDSVPSGLSAGELWATVPKHVQTLLALERLEEEQEVAQFSYKRPFQEKRHELIERLLDPILSLEDTARLLNVCPTTVRRYTNKGILTYYRKEPDRTSKPGLETATDSEELLSQSQGKETRQRRFRLSDILAFLETQQAALEADRKSEEVGAGAIRKRRRPSAEQVGRSSSDLL